MAMIPSVTRPITPTLRPKILATDDEDVTDAKLDGTSLDLELGRTTARKRYTVSNLTGDGFQRLINAANASTIPLLGTVEPLLGVPLSHISVSHVPGNPHRAHVDLNYGFRETSQGPFDNDPDDNTAPPLIDIIVVLEAHETAFDVNGVLLEAPEMTGPDVEPPDEPETFDAQPGRAQLLMPSTTIVARRRERRSPGQEKAPRFNGRVNGTRVFADAPHYWMAKIEGSSDDGGLTYNVTYTFKRNVFTWLLLLVQQGKDGRPRKGVTLPAAKEPGAAGNGSKYWQLYRDDEFRDLQLPSWFFGAG